MRALAVLALAPLLAGCLTGGDPAQLAPARVGGFSDTSVFPGDYDTTQGFGRTLQPGRFKALPAEVVELPSEQGQAVTQVGLLRPSVPEGTRVPVIAQASPYFAPLLPDNVVQQAFYPGLNFLPHGYAIALIAVRGTAGNEGCMEYFGPNERADLDQAITWLGTQPWSNGRVGMWGGSYDGGTQFQAASTGNPHLKTIVPLAGVSDPYTLLFSNGTASNRGVWHPFGYWQNAPPAGTPTGPWNGQSAERFLAKQQCTEAYDGTEEGLAAAQGGGRTPFWEVRDPRPGILANYRGSIFVIQGLQDFNVMPSQQYPLLTELQDRGVAVKHLLGQWMHMLPDVQTGPDLANGTHYGFPYILGSRLLDYALAPNPHVRWDGAEVLLHWYDYWLKDDRTVDLGPLAQVEDSQGLWRDEARWPPADAQPLLLYLGGDGTLGPEPGPQGAKLAGPSPVHLLSVVHTEDAGLQGACPACAVFEGAPLGEELRISGLPQLRLRVTPQGPGGQVHAYFYAVEAARTWRVTTGSLDLRFADGSDQPTPVNPGQPLDVVVQLEPADALLLAGTRLQLVLAQGAQSDHATALEMPFAPAFPFEVAAGGEGAVLELPTIARGPEAFFEPPR